MGRHRHVLFGSSLPNMVCITLDYDSRYSCGGKLHVIYRQHTSDRQSPQAFVFFGFLVAGEEIESKSPHRSLSPASLIPSSSRPLRL